MNEPDVVSTEHRQAAATSETSSTWRIAAGVVPMPLALLLDGLYSPDASERFQLVFVFHFFLWPYSLVWAIVVAFINEYIVNPYIKFSAIAIPVGTLLIGFVAALTSGSSYAWATAFLLTCVLRLHYIFTTRRKCILVR